LGCTHCGSSYFSPPPRHDDFRLFYSTHPYDFNRFSQVSRAQQIIRNHLQSRITGNFLDVGCATGYLLAEIQKQTKWNVYGVELVTKAAIFAKEKLHLEQVQNTDLHSANYPSEFFDVIHISEVMEHVADPYALLAECRRILKPDGFFLLSLPNGVADRQGMIDFANAEAGVAGHASGHIYFFSELGLKHLLARTGFRIESSQTAAFKQGLRTMGLFPKRRNWQDMFRPRFAPEEAVSSEILEIQDLPPNRLVKLKYGLRNLIRVPEMHRFGLAWHLVCRASWPVNL
jgi:2-polyprenyl-3-methyl-5-hydroxy-6-metoxy-1,4-benzoquinol methylase